MLLLDRISIEDCKRKLVRLLLPEHYSLQAMSNGMVRTSLSSSVNPDRIVVGGQLADVPSIANYPDAFAHEPVVASLLADSGAIGILTKSEPEHFNFTALDSIVGYGNPNASVDLTYISGKQGREV